jgi:hypothetical protein
MPFTVSQRERIVESGRLLEIHRASSRVIASIRCQQSPDVLNLGILSLVPLTETSKEGITLKAMSFRKRIFSKVWFTAANSSRGSKALFRSLERYGILRSSVRSLGVRTHPSAAGGRSISFWWVVSSSTMRCRTPRLSKPRSSSLNNSFELSQLPLSYIEINTLSVPSLSTNSRTVSLHPLCKMAALFQKMLAIYIDGRGLGMGSLCSLLLDDKRKKSSARVKPRRASDARKSVERWTRRKGFMI